MKLKKWVKRYGGPSKLAAKLGYKLATVRAWVDGYNTPTVFDVQAIVRLSRGDLHYESLIKELKKLRRRPYQPRKKNPASESTSTPEATPNEQNA